MQSTYIYIGLIRNANVLYGITEENTNNQMAANQKQN